jgi:hypothetical protein
VGGFNGRRPTRNMTRNIVRQKRRITIVEREIT